MNNNSALGIMFRIPEHGKVKKRLAAKIGDEITLKLYRMMLHETIENVSRLSNKDIYGFYEGTLSVNLDILKTVRNIPQTGKDLGERMLNAFKWLFKKGYKKAILIGSDSPDIPLLYIEEGFLRLNTSELVIGPAEDGGYYLIGLREPIDSLFKDIRWGSSQVMEDTIKIAERDKISYSLLLQWYDIDDLKNLKRYLSRHLSNSEKIVLL